jgi:hypothetical protein
MGINLNDFTPDDEVDNFDGDADAPVDFDDYLLKNLAVYRDMVRECTQAPETFLTYLRGKFGNDERYDLRKMPDGIWCIVAWCAGTEHFAGMQGSACFGAYPIVMDFSTRDGPAYSLSYKLLDTVRWLAPPEDMTKEQGRQIQMKKRLAARNWANIRQAYIAEKKTKYRARRIVVP